MTRRAPPGQLASGACTQLPPEREAGCCQSDEIDWSEAAAHLLVLPEVPGSDFAARQRIVPRSAGLPNPAPISASTPPTQTLISCQLSPLPLFLLLRDRCACFARWSPPARASRWPQRPRAARRAARPRPAIATLPGGGVSAVGIVAVGSPTAQQLTEARQPCSAAAPATCSPAPLPMSTKIPSPTAGAPDSAACRFRTAASTT